MPPKKNKPAKAAVPSSLEGCSIAIATTRLPAGVLSGKRLADVKAEIAANKGAFVLGVESTYGCTHLVVTSDQIQRQTGKVPEAIKNDDIKIVNFDWLEAALVSNKAVDEAQYILHDRKLNKGSANVQTVVTDQKKPTASKKRGRKADAGDDDDDDDEAANSLVSKKIKSEAPEDKSTSKDAQKATSSSINVPIDDGVPYHLKVYIDDDGMIYDAALNQTNSGNNNNKFYRLQILKDASNKFYCWTRWGRVGERGSNKLLDASNFDGAFHDFQKKFKDKTGHKWDDRHGDFKPGKYAFIEKTYEDSDHEDSKQAEDDSKSTKGIKKEEEAPVESKLPKPIQRLMDLIFNVDYFNQTFAQLNYDAQKMPLGKLSKRTLLRGYDVLKDLAVLVQASVSSPGIVEKSDLYFTLIPHAFGRSKPPVLRDMDLIKREIELLETLTDMQLANNIMKEAKAQKEEKISLLDRQFNGLGMQEMTPLSTTSTEFKHLQDYLVKSTGATHHLNYHVEDIFRIERHGEFDRFSQSKFGKYPNSDRRLLWHGSRATNFGGILSQGLRIAPPEAPVSGYMFGKGVYLADMSSKSAGYTVHHLSGGIGLLLLCEAELGSPPLKLTGSDYKAGERAYKQGSISTWGVGRTAPKGWKDAGFVNKNLKGISIPDMVGAGVGPSNEPGAGLHYNEYIVYDVAQIKLRYLLRVRIN